MFGNRATIRMFEETVGSLNKLWRRLGDLENILIRDSKRGDAQAAEIERLKLDIEFLKGALCGIKATGEKIYNE